MRTAEIMPVDVGAEPAALLGARGLIEAEMNPSVNTRVVDVFGDLPECRVLESNIGHGRARQGDGVASGAKGSIEHLTRRIAQGRVGRGIAGMAGRDDERLEFGIGGCLRIAIRVTGANRGLRTPEFWTRIHQAGNTVTTS